MKITRKKPQDDKSENRPARKAPINHQLVFACDLPQWKPDCLLLCYPVFVPNTHKNREPSYKASYSFMCQKNIYIFIPLGMLACLKNHKKWYLSTGKPLNSFVMAKSVYKNLKLAPRNNNTISLSGQKYLLQRCSETRPQILPPIFHPPCSHRGNMPCLSKLTTSSLQQSQQTCMGTYLSKIEDSSDPSTMTKVFGSTHV